MEYNLPENIIQMAIECHFIQMKWSINSTEWRSREVERREHHIAEMVCAIVAKDFTNRKLLPYNK